MSPVAGWYPDPSNEALIRWWDGSQWTTYTQPTQPPQEPEPVSTDPPRALARDAQLEAALRGDTDPATGRFAFAPTLSPTADGSGREAAARALRERTQSAGRTSPLGSAILTVITGLFVLFAVGSFVKPPSLYPKHGERVVAATVVDVAGPYVDGSCAPIAQVTIDGHDYRAMARWNEVPCRWQAGIPVRVIYHPDDIAASLRVDGSDLDTWPAIVVNVIGSSILLLGIYRIGQCVWAFVQERSANRRWQEQERIFETAAGM